MTRSKCILLKNAMFLANLGSNAVGLAVVLFLIYRFPSHFPKQIAVVIEDINRVFSFFGAPIVRDDHPLKAVQAAVEMRRRLGLDLYALL